MAKKLKDTKQTGKLVADLSHLAHTYVSSYCLTPADIKKLRVLKEIRKNKNIVIFKPDKGNGVVVLDRSDYDQGILKIINDTSKFRPIKEDPTLSREGRLQRLLRKLKKVRMYLLYQIVMLYVSFFTKLKYKGEKNTLR